MNRLAREAYPGLPVILLGHSMGSFFARMYAVLYPETLACTVLSGTAVLPFGGRRTCSY